MKSTDVTYHKATVTCENRNQLNRHKPVVKVNNFFFATLVGIIPQIFLAVSIGSGLEKIIDENSEVPRIKDIIFSADIYIPVFAFFALILITIFLRKFFYKN